MGRKKLQKLAEVSHLDNVFLLGIAALDEKLTGFFNNNNKYTLEIGCGLADYSISLAHHFPEHNFIGVDVRGARVWSASKRAEKKNLKNIAFLLGRAEFLPEAFLRIKFDEIWIPFPDPFPKRRSENRRLISPGFIERYRKILLPEGRINLKTDDYSLYEYCLKILESEKDVAIIKNIPDLYSGTVLSFEESAKTKYERQHLKDGKTIKLITFAFK